MNDWYIVNEDVIKEIEKQIKLIEKNAMINPDEEILDSVEEILNCLKYNVYYCNVKPIGL